MLLGKEGNRVQDAPIVVLRYPPPEAELRTSTQVTSLDAPLARTEKDPEAKPGQFPCPPGLATVEDLRSDKQLEVVVVRNHQHLMVHTLEVPAPALEAVNNS